MSFLHILVLAIVQGITEFLPISSSGHLLLIPPLTGWPDQGLATDVMVHVGSLFAIIAYFWRDVLRILRGMGDAVRLRWTDQARIFWFIAAGTVPAILFGVVLKLFDVMDIIRANDTLKVSIVGFNAIFYGVILWVADRFSRAETTMEEITLRRVLIIGAAQALALIPGTSRSGITMTAARFLGITRTEAARFSFLLGIPAISAAGLLTFMEALEGGAPITSDAWLAAALTFFTAFGAIAFLMAIIKRVGFLPYMLYRVVLGVVLFVLLAQGVLG
ncbi:MAG: undecaprenyl-diphosphate phosphatase [Alphaproteobacteria bacterium]